MPIRINTPSGYDGLVVKINNEHGPMFVKTLVDMRDKIKEMRGLLLNRLKTKSGVTMGGTAPITFIFENCSCDEQVVLKSSDFGKTNTVIVVESQLDLSLQLNNFSVGSAPMLFCAYCFASICRIHSGLAEVRVTNVMSSVIISGRVALVRTYVDLLSYVLHADTLGDFGMHRPPVNEYVERYVEPIEQIVGANPTLFRAKLAFINAGFKKWAHL